MLEKPVIFVGMMGAGKSAIGKAVAQFVDVPYFDSDTEIKNAANMPITEIFKKYGEQPFRSLEARILSRLISSNISVVATGGGAFMFEENRMLIQQYGVSVHLDVGLDVLWQRVQHKKTRPLLNTKNPFETLKDIYEARHETYLMADISVRVDGTETIEQTCQKVLEHLGQKGIYSP